MNYEQKSHRFGGLYLVPTIIFAILVLGLISATVSLVAWLTSSFRMRVIMPTVMSKRPSGWRSRNLLAVSLLAVVWCGMARAAPYAAAVDLVETNYLAERVAKGKLPPVHERAPTQPSIVEFDGKTKRLGTPGGDLNMIIGRAKDTRLLVVYGYARLVAYDETFRLVADLLESFEVEDNRAETRNFGHWHANR